MRALWRREEKKTRAKKKRRSSPRERAKRRKKRATSTPARPSNRAFERRNAIPIQRIALESTSRFGKPSTFAPRENFSLPAFASFPTRNALHTRETREKHILRKKCPSPKIDFFERPPERDVIQSTALTSTSSKDHLPKSFTSCVASSAILFVVVMLSRVTFLFFLMRSDVRENGCKSLGPFFYFFLPLFSLPVFPRRINFFFLRRLDRELFFAFFSPLFSSLGKSFEEEESFFTHSLVRLYDGGSSIRCAHTHASTTRFARERERKEKKRERGEEEERDGPKERERERRIAFFKKEEGKIINDNKNTF